MTRMSFVLWRCQGLFNGPTSIESVAKRLFCDAVLFRPFQQRLKNSVECERYASGRVPELLAPCRPTTIARLIITIIIDAVQRVFRRWTWTHITIEVGEQRPSFRNSDTSSGILRVMAFLAASTSYVFPRLILWQFSQFRLLSINAAAIQNISFAELLRRSFDRHATGTDAFPNHVSVVPDIGWSDSRQVTKGSACQIVGQMMQPYTGFSHADSSHTGTVPVRGRWSLSTVIGLAFNYPTQLEAFA